MNDDLERRMAAQTQALRQAKAESQAIFEAMPDLVLVVSAEGEILKVASANPDLLYLPAERVVGERINAIVAPEQAALFISKIEETLATGTATQFEYSLPGAETERWLEASIAPLEEAAGEKTVVWVARDITDRKRIEQELRRSNEELQRFAYVASHDLQEPLRMVTSYLELLQRRYQGQLDKDADEFINYAVDGATRMKGLIDDLLAYSRAGTRGQPLAPTDMEAELQRVLQDLEMKIRETGATLTHDPLPVVMGDAGQLRQLLQNLLENALKFSGERPPEIHLGVEKQGVEWTFCVADNGIGLDPQYANRIFVIFQRLHPVGVYPGTGIGLAICKKIVTRHGGQIWVKSAPGAGATFCFSLPATGLNKSS